MKTIYEIVQEYLNRQKNPLYESIDVKTDEARVLTYNEITNLHEELDKETGRWLVFDSKWENREKHIHIKGWVVRYSEIIKTTGDMITKKYKKITVYTHSGERENFYDVSNLLVDNSHRIVEFDTTVKGQKLHVIKNPGSLEHSEEILN